MSGETPNDEPELPLPLIGAPLPETATSEPPPIEAPRTIFTAESLSLLPSRARQPALVDISLALNAGEILSVLGRQGSGGEVLRDALIGRAASLPISSAPARQPRARRAAFIVAGTLTFGDRDGAPRPRMVYLAGAAAMPLSRYFPTASQMARVLARREAIPLSSAMEELRMALARVSGAPDLERLRARPYALRPRELALALLALATAQGPDAIVAGDPALGLDPLDAEELILRLLEARERGGFALAYFTGSPQTSARLGGRIAVLRDGRVIEEGSAGRLASEHAHAYTRALFRAVPRFQENPQQRPQPSLEPLLQVRNIAFEKPPKNAAPARGLTFDLRRGGSVALIGEYGSGRRAISRAVLGLEPVPQGRIVFDAVDMGALSATMRVRLRRRVAFVSGDDAVLDPTMTVLEVVTEPLRAHVNLGREANRRAAESALKRTGLGDMPLKRLTVDLDPLNRRRLQVARALAAAPHLVVLYEPLAGLDALGQALMLDLLKDFRLREGVAYLLVTADFALALALADQGIVIRDRRAVESGAVADLVRSPRETYTRQLVEAVFPLGPSLV